MPILFAITLILGTIASGLLLGSIFVLRAKYNLKFLDTYTYFILLVVCYGLVNWIGPSIVSMNYSYTDQDSYGAVALFVSVAIPLSLAKLWMFVRLLWSMSEMRLEVALSRSFILFSGICVLTVLASFLHDSSGRRLGTTLVVLTMVGVAVLVANMSAISYYLANSTGDGGSLLVRYARRFGWSYMIGYALYASPYYLSYVLDFSWYPFVSPYIYYLMHIVPLIFVWQYSAQLDKEGYSRLTTSVSIDPIVERYGISSREKDVVRLILNGLNNAEIANRLFISANTVRNHIYNIYRKLGIKNRIQLKQSFED